MTTGLWTSERLIFRAVEVEDEAFLGTLDSDPEAYVGGSPFMPVPQGKDAAKRFREYLVAQLCSAVICLPPPAAGTTTTTEGTITQPIPIGIIHLNAPTPQSFSHHHRSEIGINIARPYQGQGYGSEAIRWALRFGFRHANLHRIEINAFEWNTGAARLYERLGFKPESRKRDYWWHDGKYWESLGFAMLEDEFRELYDKETQK